MLSMSNLLNLPLKTRIKTKSFNIPQKLGPKHFEFAMALDKHSVLGGQELRIAMRIPLSDPVEINTHILQVWLDCLRDSNIDEDMSWQQLSNALLEVGDAYLATHVSCNRYQVTLTISNLLNFPYDEDITVTKSANIPREVGVKYFDFGIHLLQDITGAHIRDLEHEHSKCGEKINKIILSEWLEGKGRPVTWATLVEVLRIIELGELAREIEEKYVKKTKYTTTLSLLET